MQTALAEEVVKLLKEKKMTVTTVESCTGGLLSGTLVDVVGASDVFMQGFVTYANEAKVSSVGVKEATLEAYGAVSEQTAREMAEGGAKNVARRDGMATTVLSAAQVIGRIPDSYFQAVGSGTGTIAAYESNLRLIADGRFGSHLMKLIPSQNIPFTPMYDAFKADSRALLPFDEDEARVKALEIDAKVLSNRRPPYSLAGGLYDAVKATGGDIELATNEELREACQLFEKVEGNDVHPAAGVAIVSLKKALASGKISKDEVVMLNITGGGEKRFKREFKYVQAEPDLVIPSTEDSAVIIEKVLDLFK